MTDTGGLAVDLVLAVQAPDASAALVCRRTPDGAATAAVGAWPDPVPSGALFLYWPARLAGLPAPSTFAEAILAEGGAVFPLTAILGRLGIPSPRTYDGLLEAMGVGFGDVEDAPFLGRLLVKVLAERLSGIADGEDGFAPPPRAKHPPRPEVAAAVEVLPAEPGVYRFTTHDDKPLYVGKARSLAARVQQYFGPAPAEDAKSERLARDAVALSWRTTGSELEALLVEQRWIRRDRPILNVQEAVHPRDRGAWRDAACLCVLPSAEPDHVEACLVAGEGRLHWERLPRARHVPGAFWTRVKAFLAGEPGGWAPGEPGSALRPDEASALAEIALSWLAAHGDRVSRIDLAGETGGRDLAGRVRRLLGEDPAAGRIQVV